MLFDSLAFKSMQGSIGALWEKQKIISHNIANYDTPNYKARELSFEDIYAKTRQEGQMTGKYQFQATITQDNTTLARPDGNNVDVEKEELELIQTYYQSAALYQKLNGQITNMKNVLSQASFK